MGDPCDPSKPNVDDECDKGCPFPFWGSCVDCEIPFIGYSESICICSPFCGA